MAFLPLARPGTTSLPLYGIQQSSPRSTWMQGVWQGGIAPLSATLQVPFKLLKHKSDCTSILPGDWELSFPLIKFKCSPGTPGSLGLT